MPEEEDQTEAEAAPRESSPLRTIIEVQAGIIPGDPMPEYQRRYAVNSDQWDASEDQGLLLLETYARAHAYSLTILDPQRVNWVQVNWIWL